MAIFAACAEVLLTNVDTGPRNLMATSCAVIVSILTNFFLNDGWTWRDRRAQGTSMLLRLAKYYLVAGIAGFVQIGIQYTLSITFGLNAHLANFTGIGAGIFINFFVNNLWTFRAPRADSIDGAADALKSNTEHGEHHIALVPKTP